LEILGLLLDAWREQPWGHLADLIEALSQTLESAEAHALRDDGSKYISKNAWAHVAQHHENSSPDRGALISVMRRGTLKVIADRIVTAEHWPRDPRLSSELAQWFVHVPFRSTSSRSVWAMVGRLLRNTRDRRIINTLQPTLATDWAWDCGGEMQRYFRRAVERIIESIESLPALDIPGHDVDHASLTGML